ncbi:MAG: LysR substrate-binding domain-containing protein [Acetobacteraceae bacterium]
MDVRPACPPASVFRHINALEDMLGAQLLNRTSRKLSLTEAGDLYSKRLEQILTEIQETHADVAQLQMVPRGTLRVHCRVSLGAQHVAPALPDFLTRYPEVRLDLSLSDRAVDMVQENIDVAIRIGQMRDSSLIVRKLAISPRIVCASPAYLVAHPKPEVPNDLISHNCLTYRNAVMHPTWRFMRNRKVDEIRVTGNLLADHAEVVRLGALSGLGIALLPEWSIGGDLREGLLIPLLLDYEATPIGFDNGIYAVMQRSRHRSMKVRLFLDFLVALFRERRHWGRDAAPEDVSPATPVPA